MGLVLEHNLQNSTPVQILVQCSAYSPDQFSGKSSSLILVLSPQKDHTTNHFIPIKVKSNLRLTYL